MTIEFKSDNSFIARNVNNISYLYFPITNGYNLKSSITPNLNGDIKTDQNHYALLPVSEQDLQNSLFGRHFWLNINNYGLYNVSGISARQKLEQNESVDINAGFLYHTVTRINKNINLKFTIITFSPYGKENIELTKITIKNIGDSRVIFTPTVAIPLYSRSADNLRDHRHVTSLLNSTKIVQNGIINKPKLSFDERGHLKNNVTYGVFVSDIVEYYNPKLHEFIGEGGSLDCPKSLLNDNIGNYQVGDICEGYEVIGAMQLRKKILEKDETTSYCFAIMISDKYDETQNIVDEYCNIEMFDKLLEMTKVKWDEILSTFSLKTYNNVFDKWLKWVALQPIIRRLFGCSFLPHHDYGRGGRGWRDLWQDALALLLLDNKDIKTLLFNNYAGVRIDGTNATIIGENPGEFIADRNNISRVWMDHGVWPWFTTKLYIERTGDISFLFLDQVYFNDKIGNQLTNKNIIYKGNILEHILVQNLVQFYNVGDNNNILIANADWNDGLDMASDRGESVSFTAFYCQNLDEIKNLLLYLKENNFNNIEVFKELSILINDNLDYQKPQLKQNLLREFLSLITNNFTGEKIQLPIIDVINSLEKKSNFLKEHIVNNEWITVDDSTGFFNGYYDNDGKKLEGIKENNIQMSLTAQVFPLMSKIVDNKRINMVINAVNKFLYDENISSYRLNTNFNELKLNMGRLFGFAYGHKENGAIFNHMVMMYVYALYKNNYVKEAYKIIKDTFSYCMNFNYSKIYPGIPEYFDIEGRGMYHYLTGASSWLIFIIVSEMFGIKGYYGNLLLLPKLTKDVFNNNSETKIITMFNNHKLNITYVNKYNKDVFDYSIKEIKINNKLIIWETLDNGAVIHDKYLSNYENINIKVILE